MMSFINCFVLVVEPIILVVGGSRIFVVNLT